MSTTKPKAPRKLPQQRLTLPQQLAHDYNMAVMKSTATAEILDEDGYRTDRLIYVGDEYSSKFCKKHGITGGAA